MATRTITIGERKAELEALIAQSQNAQLQAQNQLNDLQRKADASTDRKTLEAQYLEACRAEALGQPNNRAKLEIDILAIDARRKGFDSLIAEARAKVASIENARAPIEAQLGDILRQERVDAWIAEIQASVTAGEAEVAQHLALTASLGKRLAALRNYEDPAVRKMGLDAAERLWRLSQGMQP